MSALLDINILLAYGWRQHPFHSPCSAWVDSISDFVLCPITELGFLRVSMSPAFRASYEDASRVLGALSKRKEAIHLACDQSIEGLPPVSSYKNTTDAYLVHLARNHSYRLATLDAGILNKRWADGIAFNPIET